MTAVFQFKPEHYAGYKPAMVLAFLVSTEDPNPLFYDVTTHATKVPLMYETDAAGAYQVVISLPETGRTGLELLLVAVMEPLWVAQSTVALPGPKAALPD